MKNGIWWRLVWVGALLIRFVALDQSLWLDEATTAQVVRRFSFVQIVTQYAPHDFHPPLYYLFIKAWSLFFGTGEMALRLPSLLASMAAGYVVYLLSVRIASNSGDTTKGSQRIGKWAAALFLFNPLILYYSQEARMYMMAVLLATLLIYLNWQVLTERERIPGQRLIWVNIVTGLLLGTFYASAFFIASLHILFALKRRWRELWQQYPGGLLSLLLVSPLLIAQIRYSSTALAAVPHWSLVLGRAEFKNVILFPVKFATGRYDLNTSTDLFIVGGWCLILYGALLVGLFQSRQDKRRWRVAWSGLFLVIAPIFLGYVVSWFKPMMQYFRFLYVVPFLLVTIILMMRNNKVRAVLLIGSVAWCLIYVLVPAHHREDWKSLAVTLPDHATVYMIPSSSDPLMYYRPDIRIADISAASSSREPVLFVVPYVFPVYGIDESAILKPRFTLLHVSHFRALSYEVWRRNESR